jgi:hypothetical protein
MKIAALGCLIFALPAAAQPPDMIPGRDDRWREDVRYLAQQVTSLHPNFFTQTPRERFDAAVATLLDEIPSKTDHEIVLGMHRLLALGGDAHTMMGVPAAYIRQYPLAARWFSDGLYVTGAALQYVRAIGKRITRIGDLPIEDVYARVSELIAHENDPWVRHSSPAYLLSPEVLHYLGILSEPGSTTYMFTDDEGGDFSLEIARLGAFQSVIGPHNARFSTPLYQRNSHLNYWFEYIEYARALYVKYNVCSEAPLLPFADFMAEIRAFGAANAIDRVVIDVRSNPGGNSSLLWPLRDALREAGPPIPVYVIISKQTFSSGMLNAIELKQIGASLVGEATGGKPSGYGEVKRFTLPHSGLSVQYSTRLFNIPGFRGESVFPDMAVEFRGRDYFADRDPYLEAALR